MKRLFLIWGLVSVAVAANAQIIDSLFYSVYTGGSINSKGVQTHYMSANRWGIWDESQNSVLSLGRVKMNKEWKQWQWETGFSFIAHTGSENPYKENDIVFAFHEYYSKLSYRKAYFCLGANKHTVGAFAEELSSGALGLSRNARPVPKLEFGIEYIDIPFTLGLIQVKGHVANGWLEKKRFASKAMLHEKSVFFRVGKSLPIELEGGFVHFAQWGGRSSAKGKLPCDWTAFQDVFLGRGNSNFDSVLLNEVNGLGNHLGNINYSLKYKHDDFSIQLYRQVLFDDKSGMSSLNKDGLNGIYISLSKSRWVSKINFEFLNTKNQGGFREGGKYYDENGNVIIDEKVVGPDNFYNNLIYGDGWSYYGRSIGSPLIMSRNRLLSLGFSEDELSHGGYFENNRIRALHLGINGAICRNLNYKFLITSSVNYGNYYGIPNFKEKQKKVTYIFESGLTQNYSLLETDYTFKFDPRLSMTTAVAVDWGEMSNNVGFMIGFKWSDFVLLKKKKKK
ncbi:MAG: capsule assembly Wzi family protein [Cytophagales bacterium]|nr:capsule assembly Wzi family protein [Cytophagales bacterium]